MQPQHVLHSHQYPDSPSLAAEALPHLADVPVVDPGSPPRLPLRPFRPEMPPEARTLWPFDLKLSYTANSVAYTDLPALWDRMDSLMEKLLESWSSWLEERSSADLWEESQRYVLGRRARAQAECVLFWQRQLHEEGPVRGLLPKIPPLTLEDYPDSHLGVREPTPLLPPLNANPDIRSLLAADMESEGPVASPEVMALFNYHPVSPEVLGKHGVEPGSLLYGSEERDCCVRCCYDYALEPKDRGVCLAPPFIRVQSLWADMSGLVVWQRGDCLCCQKAGAPCSTSSLNIVSFYCTTKPSPETVVRKVDLPLEVIPGIIGTTAERRQWRKALASDFQAEHKPTLDEFMGDSLRLLVDPDGPSSSQGQLVWPETIFYDHVGNALPQASRALWPDQLLSAFVFHGEHIGASIWARCINYCIEVLHDVLEEVWMERTAREWGYYVSEYDSITSMRAGIDLETACSEGAREEMSQMAKKQSQMLAQLHNGLAMILKPIGVTSRLGNLELGDPYYASRIGQHR